jgi:hypothetical protein
MPSATSASRLVVELSSGRGIEAAARISDLRVEGQTPALRDYIERRLRFAGSDPRTR